VRFSNRRLAWLLCLFALLAALLWACSAPRARVTPFERLGRALDAGDDLAAVRACEDYLQAAPKKDNDPQRTAFVRSMYSRVFVSWFLRQGGRDAVVDERVARYRALMVAPAPGGAR
jgi:hypothetical protein